MRVTVLTGGATAERAVAFASASQIVAALRNRKHDVHVVDLAGSVLDDRGERELLGGAVGTAPPSVDALAERSSRPATSSMGSTNGSTGARLSCALRRAALALALTATRYATP